jgi:hypothetical protein
LLVQKKKKKLANPFYPSAVVQIATYEVQLLPA